MNIVFLEASVPLTKSYAKSAQGIVKTPYPFTFEFTSHKETITTLAQLEASLTKHAALGHCVLKGTIARDLVAESRAGSTDTNATTEWLVLDLDGLPETTTHNATLTIELFLKEIGLPDTSYIVQWSASYGIENKRIRAHIFMLLDQAYSAPLLKQWLMQKNFETPLLNNAMGLTKTGNSISWPLDVSACQNDKLIYIAPPGLKGIKDPLGKKPRIELIKKKHDKLSLKSLINTSAKNKELTHARIAELREAAGLPARKFAYKMHGSTEVMIKPDECVITDMKIERGFVYFNLNGGDSWAYFHPENKPDYILNFKGEPAYLTKELLPEYWSQLAGAGSSTRTSSQGLMYLAFCDRRTGIYWRGTYDASTDFLDLTPAKNETQLRHFGKQFGLPIGDFVPEWDLTFDPHNPTRVDPQARIVNQFQQTLYMLNASSKTTKTPRVIPRVISRVISSALGNDTEIETHFINWLATIVQSRGSTGTAWVLHGLPGTGKGILTNKILKPLFGSHTATRRMESLNEKYNDFMQSTFLVFVDEVQTKALQNERSVMAKLKNFITEPFVAIRRMYANDIEVPNYTNWIFMSNMPDPVAIDKEDRRYNVGKYQDVKLVITADEIDRVIPSELQAFYDFLLNYPADHELARKVIESYDRTQMISITENSVDTVASALLDGKFEFFLEHLPTDNTHVRNAVQNNRVEDYTALLKSLAARTIAPIGSCAIGREELRTLFDFCVGNMPSSPNKFTSLLKHHRIHMGAVWVAQKTVRGITTTWQDYHLFPALLKNYFPAAVVQAVSSTSATTKVSKSSINPVPILPATPRTRGRPVGAPNRKARTPGTAKKSATPATPSSASSTQTPASKPAAPTSQVALGKLVGRAKATNVVSLKKAAAK